MQNTNSSSAKDQPRVAHVAIPFLQPTETFIYDRITHHSRYTPMVLTDEPPVNLDIFPFSPIYSLSELPAHARKTQNALRRITGRLSYFLDIIKKEHPAVLHAHYGPVGAALLPLCAKAKIPLITSFYGIDASAFLRHPRHSRAYSRLWRDCRIISVLSENMKAALTAAGCPEHKIRIHHLAVDTDAMRPAGARPPAPPLKIVCASRLVEKKGGDVLLRAAALVKKEIEIELHIAGTGPLEDELRVLASELGLGNCVHFHGRVGRGEVLELMSGAHIFVLLSRTATDGDSEGTPTALIEAGALALPAVSTPHAGIPEVVENEITGILVGENDHHAAARAILRLAASEKLRAEMGAAAREKIVREFSIHSVMAQIEADYDTLSVPL